MPTAHDYRRAASRFRAVADLVEWYGDGVARWRVAEHVSGPPADAAADALGRAASHLVGVATGLSALARECDRRADICATFHARLRTFRELDPGIRAVLMPPVRPFPWVA